jgi:flavodoxin
MSTKVLAIYYSQSGQLEDIVDNLTAPLSDAGISVEKVRIRPKMEYPFPWTSRRFFDAMPESVMGIPTALQPFLLKESAYDLVIFGYQPWFLSPSIPSNSILQDPVFQSVLKNTPVVTITGARNMWINAMEGIKRSLHQTGAKRVGNIVLVDKHHNFISFVTILYWMFSGKRDRYLNIFPKPGVADRDVLNTKNFGATLKKYIDRGDWEGMQAELVSQKALVINYHLMFIESKAGRIFSIWARIIIKKKKRTAWLVAFKYYLLIALFIAAPIILTVDAIFFRPFLSGRIRKQKQYYSDLN